ncbi:hypothetical protein FGSG_08294 [Fusarium graminearum PH-1]|uniref:Chromosome 2, complete genome n=1 Tax=Gibberella zeae (strain ATCC MYA-4620 / CBS 123657 / FGSC 9075 / NRRL 31084 / PH-1) TaxID=229533 RepID=I1RVL3_GIBZE|nr:hypothetical protein FGSG_08294 [Fusarium graminearum PH-1]ESU15074.1 hypothetical protein FGSG_08294 [Fusarium graminearum PH-1]CEF76596.1 unnamed protein product [Fusarium graminearum]|eukprot:XP_011320499.1 hypothetical protein FGSG_08294 [Fusarium graminearum PH-1]
MSVPCLVENDALADWAAWDESLALLRFYSRAQGHHQRQSSAREHLMGSLYAHLPCSEVDWALEGTAVCRVVGIGCYGLDIPGWARLQRHLQTAAHLRHEEALAAAWVETAQQVAVVEDGGLPAERAMNSAHSSVGDGEALRLPLDAVIPDSDSEGTTPGAGVQTGRRSDLQDHQG